MTIHPIDLAIVVAYLILVVLAGFWVTRRAAEGIESYFLGGRRIHWFWLGLSNASGMFDISGTTWLVAILFLYGLKSLWLPWIWPTFNQVFLMVYLATWLRRSNVMTGAEWLKTRFGSGPGYELAHAAVVLFAFISVIGFQAYAFQGIGKFAAIFLPGNWSPAAYATVIMAATGLYVVAGGMYSVVITDVIQWSVMTVASVTIFCIALTRTSAAEILARVPEGWQQIGFGTRLDLDWSTTSPALAAEIERGGYEFFSLVFGLMIFKGILASLAGPAPNYDLQRILSTRRPSEASWMSAVVSPVLFLPRYCLVAGIVGLAIVFLSDEYLRQPAGLDLEQILPLVLSLHLPVGIMGLTLAGLLAAFMSTFDSTVNAGAAYLVQDVYRARLVPNASHRHYLYVSYVTSAVIVVLGIVVGWYFTQARSADINRILQWITAGLYGGYIAPNVLKWHWWRLNAYGYFVGMLTGTVLAVLLASDASWFSMWLPTWMRENALYTFPLLFGISVTATIVMSLLTPPDDLDTLRQFYRQVRPWGWWGPVRESCAQQGNPVTKNANAGRDLSNCGIGMIWQVALTALPIYLLLRDTMAIAACAILIMGTTWWLKCHWLNTLRDWPSDLPANAQWEVT